MASTDRWFRPVSLADGPDGALYVVDMHREVIEHPDYLPQGVGKDLRFRAGAEKGRILRIKRPDVKAKPFTPPSTTKDMLALLNDSNGWRRDLGQRLLIERNAMDAIPELRRTFLEGRTRAGVHALWTLRGLNALTADDLFTATIQGAPDQYREAALLAGAEMVPENQRLQVRVRELAGRTAGRVRMLASLLLGDFDFSGKGEALADAAVGVRGFDPWIGRAVVSSSARLEGEVFQASIRLMNVHTETAEFMEFLEELCAAAVHRDENQLRAVLTTLASSKQGSDPQLVERWQVAALIGLGEGFAKPNRWKTKGVVAFFESPPEGFKTEAKRIAPLLAAVENLAFDREAVDVRRLRASAIRIAAQRTSVRPRLLELIGAKETAEVQIAIFKSLEHGDSRAVVDKIVANWSGLPPAVQQAAVDFCFRRRDSQKMFLEAIAAGKASASAIGAERREMMLVFSRDEEMKALAKKLFGASASNRAALIEQYLPSTRQSAAANKGAEVFKRVCASCHRLKGVGVAVGPELADVRQKAKETLLTDILDPNRTVEPRYTSYIAALVDGRTVVGLLSSESSASITLRLPNGVDETIPRSEIEQFRSSGRSLMPEGVEKDVTPAQMADLLEFLCSPN